MGDFQGVVTLGVARAKKCIFPIRGARFSKGVPPHVHAGGVHAPVGAVRRCCWRSASVLLAPSVGVPMYMPKGVHAPSVPRRCRWRSASVPSVGCPPCTCPRRCCWPSASVLPCTCPSCVRRCLPSVYMPPSVPSVGAAGAQRRCCWPSASAHPRKMGGNLGDFQGVVTLGVAGG